MAVVEKISIQAIIPSSQEIQQLQNSVMQIEDLAERSKTAEDVIRETTTKRTGGIFGGVESGQVPKAELRRKTDSLTSRVADQKNANSFKNKDTTSAAAFTKNSSFKQVQKEVSQLKDAQAKTNDALSFITNFQGTAFTKVLGAANSFFPAAFAISVATTVFGLIRAQFGKGGLFDTRKTELDAVKSLIGLERETDIIGGETLFLGNTTLVQGVSHNQTSNTENLRDGQRRFVLRSNGF